MGLESASRISQLNQLWPLGTDPRSQGDDHIRLVKKVLVGADFTGLAAKAQSLEINGGGSNGKLSFTANEYLYGATNAIWAFVAGAGAAKIDPVGITATSGSTVMTREKGDSRYVQASGGNQMTGELVLPSLRVNGGGSAGRVAFSTNDYLYGTASNIVVFIDDAQAARFDAAGTAASSTSTVMTREKGDLRYALASSSRRFKEALEPAPGPVPGFAGLVPQHWIWGGELAEDDPRRGEVGFGLIAEDVEAVLPEAVTRDGEGRPVGLDALALVGALVAEIAGLRARLEALESLSLAQAQSPGSAA